MAANHLIGGESAARRPDGRFGPGGPGGPGRPPKAVERRYARSIAKLVTSDRWERVVEAALAQAEGGDHQARQWLTSVLFGERLKHYCIERLVELGQVGDGNEGDGNGDA